jgi:hypothetical protein
VPLGRSGPGPATSGMRRSVDWEGRSISLLTMRNCSRRLTRFTPGNDRDRLRNGDRQKWLTDLAIARAKGIELDSLKSPQVSRKHQPTPADEHESVHAARQPAARRRSSVAEAHLL